ncbi:hypothetical protein Tco_1200414 [Tanacetum coccineum]
MNGWILEDDEEEEEEEDPEMEEEIKEENPDIEEEMEEENNDDDAELLLHAADHEQEAEADTVGTITREGMPTLYIARSRALLNKWLNLANTVTHSTLKRLSVMDRYLAEFDTDLRSEIKGQHALRRSLKAPVARADPDDPSARPTRRPRRDDPYVMLEDNVARMRVIMLATNSNPYQSQHLDPTIMPPKRRTQTNPQPTLTREAADQLVREGIEAALSAERERVRMEATRAGGPAGGPAAAPVARECSFMGFMKCGPTQFHGNEGAVELCRWFEKIESVFGISECAKRSKVKFAAATLQGRALTWWNSQVATLGLDVVNGKSWTDMRKIEE